MFSRWLKSGEAAAFQAEIVCFFMIQIRIETQELWEFQQEEKMEIGNVFIAV